MARQYWVTGNYGDVRRDEIVIRTAQRAVEIDPGLCPGLGAAGDCSGQLALSSRSGVDDGLAAAERSIEARSDALLRRTVSAPATWPNKAISNEAEAEIRRGLELDPDSWEVNREAARLLMQHRRVRASDCSIIMLAASLDENDFHSWMMLLTCCPRVEPIGTQARSGATNVASEVSGSSRRTLQRLRVGRERGGAHHHGRSGPGQGADQRAMMIDPENINMPL